ncbi:MAG: HEAT repeat domain-containing protein [Solirubrobacteraceae bacterium]
MEVDPVTAHRRRGGGETDAADIVLAGRRGDTVSARRALSSSDPRLREVALGALHRANALDDDTLVRVLRSDPVAGVRRRACDLAAPRARTGRLTTELRRALGDPDALVAEAACWALGELYAGKHRCTQAVAELSKVASAHADARVREAAIAALGSIGHETGLRAVLDALGDRPSVRRRAVVALAAFDGEEVADALERGTSDRDWQVREVAEILLDGAWGDDRQHDADE